MTRSLDAATETAIAAATGEKVKLVQLSFASAVTRMTTAGQDIVWDSQTWEAVGGHLDAEGYREVANGEAPGCRVRLSGVDQSIITLILANNYRGRKATVWEARLDPATGTVIDDPLIVFDGYMNEGFSITETRDEHGGGTVEIETRLADKISDLQQRRGVRTNLHSHQREIPGAEADTFFQHVAAIASRKIFWGTKTPGNSDFGDGKSSAPDPTGTTASPIPGPQQRTPDGGDPTGIPGTMR